MRKIIIIIALCAITLPVFAQTQDSVRERKTAVKSEARAVAENMREQMEQRQAEFKEMLGAQRSAVKSSIEAKRADLRQRLQTIRDEQKRKTVERIDAQMDALNERWTNHFSNVLDRLEGIVEKIEERMAQAETRGRDVSAVKAAISEAKSAIAASRTAVAAQAGKTYAITVTTEDGLRTEVGKARKALHDDLAAARDTVKSARDAVHGAATALAQAVKAENQQATTTPEAIQNTQ